VREVWPVGLNRECLQTATPHHPRAPITLVGLSHDGIASSILRRWPMLGLIPSMLKAALGVAVAADDPIEGVMAFLSDQRMLVVCDSCEHVVGAADVLVEKVLKGAPGADVLATGREPFRARAKVSTACRRWKLRRRRPASLPSSTHVPAVQLLLDRAVSSWETVTGRRTYRDGRTEPGYSHGQT